MPMHHHSYKIGNPNKAKRHRKPTIDGKREKEAVDLSGDQVDRDISSVDERYSVVLTLAVNTSSVKEFLDTCSTR